MGHQDPIINRLIRLFQWEKNFNPLFVQLILNGYNISHGSIGINPALRYLQLLLDHSHRISGQYNECIGQNSPPKEQLPTFPIAGLKEQIFQFFTCEDAVNHFLV